MAHRSTELPPADDASRTARRRNLAAFALLVALPLFLRLHAIDHGDGGSYVPDSHVVRQALGMARDRDLVPPVGKYSTYPNLLPYLLLPVYLGQYILGALSGAWKDAAGYADAVSRDPALVAVPARVVVALFSAATAWVVWRAARAAGLARGAWVAAWLASTCLLSIQFATHERPWAVVSFFTALSAWAAIVHARDATAKSLCWSGLAAGAAFSAHQAGLGALFLPFAAWLVSPRPWRGALAARIKEGFLAVGAFAAVGLLIGHPYLLVHGRTPAEAVVGGAQMQQLDGLTVGGMPVVFSVRTESAERLAATVFGYDPLLVLLALGGLVVGLRSRRLRAVALFVLVWSLFFLFNQSDHVRYLLPGLVAATILAGAWAERWWERPATRVALVLLLVLPLVQAARFASVLARPDTRVEGPRLAAQAGGLLLVDRYGPDLELDRESLLLLRDLRRERGEDLRVREAARLARLEAGSESGGVRAVRLEELFDGDERSGTIAVRKGLEARGATPAELLRSLQVASVLEVRRRTSGDPAAPDALHLYDELWAGGRELARVDPAGSAAQPGLAREMLLPVEMDFPLTALWSVERPGPLLRLVALPR